MPKPSPRLYAGRLSENHWANVWEGRAGRSDHEPGDLPVCAIVTVGVCREDISLKGLGFIISEIWRRHAVVRQARV